MYLDIQKQYHTEAPILPLFQRVEQVGLQKGVNNWTSGGAVAAVMYKQVTKGQ